MDQFSRKVVVLRWAEVKGSVPSSSKDVTTSGAMV
jgi:hypothetical protein